MWELPDILAGACPDVIETMVHPTTRWMMFETFEIRFATYRNVVARRSTLLMRSHVSKGAFNALLKTPKSLLNMSCLSATTEFHRIPDTISSRYNGSILRISHR